MYVESNNNNNNNDNDNVVLSAVNMVNGITVNGLGEVAIDQGTSLISLGNFNVINS